MADPDSIPEIQRTVSAREHVSTGDSVTLTKRITEDDVLSLARATGDENRLHIDERYATQTRFGGRIAHGVLGMGMLSGAMASLPGCPIILRWGSTTFESPIAIGDVYQAVARILEADERYGIDHTWVVGLELQQENGDILIDGQATVLLDPAPDVEPTVANDD